MALFNYATKEVTLKIVYYGPGLSGKTTNLQYLHSSIDPSKRGKLLSLATEADRTLFFDFMPVELGKVRDFSIRFQLYTVPGQVRYNATRKLVLKGADAVVFVADSQRGMLHDNLESLENMYENLRANNINPDEIPIVLQYNKRDLADVMSVEELNEHLNKKGYPYFEAVAIEGTGVNETFQAVVKLLLKQLADKYKIGLQTQPTEQPQPKQTSPEPPPPPPQPEPSVVDTPAKEPLLDTSSVLEEFPKEEEPSLAAEEPSVEIEPEINSFEENFTEPEVSTTFDETPGPQSSLKEPVFEEDLSSIKTTEPDINSPDQFSFPEEEVGAPENNWLDTAKAIEKGQDKEEPLITEEKMPEPKSISRDDLITKDVSQKQPGYDFDSSRFDHITDGTTLTKGFDKVHDLSGEQLEEIIESIQEIKKTLSKLRTQRDSSVHLKVSIEKLLRTMESIQENQTQMLKILKEIQTAINKAKTKRRWLLFR